MFSNPSLTSAKSFNADFFSSTSAHTTTHPIALIVGGTSGIGRGIARALSSHTKGSCRILIVGRNKVAGGKLIATFAPFTGEGEHEFISCDITLMANVHALTQELSQRLPKLNYLFITAGYVSLKGYNPTTEGIDSILAVYYYARFKFIYELLPLLQKAKDLGEEGRVMSMLNAKKDTEIDLENLGLKKKYGIADSAAQSFSYNNLMVEVRLLPLFRPLSLSSLVKELMKYPVPGIRIPPSLSLLHAHLPRLRPYPPSRPLPRTHRKHSRVSHLSERRAMWRVYALCDDDRGEGRF